MRLKPEQCPKILYTNSSGEYWGGDRTAALTHTPLDGREDACEEKRWIGGSDAEDDGNAGITLAPAPWLYPAQSSPMR